MRPRGVGGRIAERSIGVFPRRRAALALAGAFVVSTATAAEPMRRLGGREIGLRLGGAEIGDGIHWRMTLHAAGRLETFALGHPGTGRWRIAGGELCIERPVDGERCFAVRLGGRRIQLRRFPAPPIDAVLLARRRRPSAPPVRDADVARPAALATSAQRP